MKVTNLSLILHLLERKNFGNKYPASLLTKSSLAGDLRKLFVRYNGEKVAYIFEIIYLLILKKLRGKRLGLTILVLC